MKEWYEVNYYPSEPIFVASPGSRSEDDGIVLSYVISEIDLHYGFLLILDGATFTEIARAEIRSDQVLYPGFHGKFIDTEFIQNSSLSI